MPAGLLGIEELGRAEIEQILTRARDFQSIQSQPSKKLDVLRGKMIVNLFFEASTRTRTSFEIAANRLGADAVSITASGSSVSMRRRFRQANISGSTGCSWSTWTWPGRTRS